MLAAFCRVTRRPEENDEVRHREYRWIIPPQSLLQIGQMLTIGFSGAQVRAEKGAICVFVQHHGMFNYVFYDVFKLSFTASNRFKTLQDGHIYSYYGHNPVAFVAVYCVIP